MPCLLCIEIPFLAPLVFLAIQHFCHAGLIWQPIVVVIISALWQPRKRNAKVFTAQAISLFLTLLIQYSGWLLDPQMV